MNLLIPVTNEDMLKFANNVKPFADTFVIVGVTESLVKKLKKRKNVKIKVFANNSKREEIINALKGDIKRGGIIICRKPISDTELHSFEKSQSDITLCSKKKRNWFANFLYKVSEVIMNFIFGFTFFEGDTSVIGFNEKLFAVVDSLGSLSYVSRVNRWNGVTFGYVDVSGAPVKAEYNKVRNNIMLVGWILLFLASVAGACVYTYFEGLNFLIGLIWVSTILLCEIGMIIAIAIYVLNIRTGERKINSAVEV